MAEPTEESPRRPGSLVVIGIGIRVIGQLTVEAIAWMEKAEALLYVVGDPIAENVVKSFNPTGAFSLSVYYREGEPRSDAYEAMVDHVLGCVRRGDRTVFACYGHPGVCAYAPHESIRRARSEGFSAIMLPAVSSLDCLFADLGVDPAQDGCQTYEAADFFERAIDPDPSSHLILWQINAFGDWNHRSPRYDSRYLPLLVKKLCTVHPAMHLVTLYEASPFFGRDPVIARIPLESVPSAPINPATTLHIPPSRPRSADPRWRKLLDPTSGH
jgi:hypothetical protein